MVGVPGAAAFQPGLGALRASGTVRSGLGAQAWRAPYGPREKYCFVFAASGLKVRSWENGGTLDLQRRVLC
ncbi:hypothetical protein STEG23_003247 [Scotinomys teguina]